MRFKLQRPRARPGADGERTSGRRKRGEVVIKDRQRPFARGVPGSGKELEAQPVEQHPKARRLMPGVEVRGTSRAAARRFLSPAPAVCIVEGRADLTVPRGATSRKENRDAE